MARLPSRAAGLAFVVGVSVVASVPSRATEYSLDPRFQLTGEYNDNVRLRSDEARADEVFSTVFTPALDLKAAHARWEVLGTARLDVRRFSGEDTDQGGGLDRTDRQLGLSSSYRTLRSEWGLSASHRVDSTLTDEIDPDIGLVVDQVQRTTDSVSPTWRYRLSPNSAIDVSYSFSDVSYEETETTNLSDFEQQSASLRYSMRMTQRAQGIARLTFSRLDVPEQQTVFSTIPGAPDQSFRSKTYGAQVGASYELSQTLSATLLAGARRTESIIESPQPIFVGPFLTGFETVETSEWSGGSLLDLSLTKRFERGRVELGLSRSTRASGVGNLLETDEVDLDLTRRLSPTVSANVTAKYLRTRAIGDDASDLADRDTIRVGPRLRWRLTRNWRLTGDYRYTRVDRQSRDEVADRNVIGLTLRYDWPRMTVSR